MPQPIDVGSILGGRYKVTGRILASAEEDVVLDGLDQVLNRPVSILVSAVANAKNLTQSARQVALGERISSVSILDLGSQEGATYLVAARTTPTDLLDLVVPTEVSTDPYQEPFFTDTLGTEIFGSAREVAPASGAYVYEDNSPLTPAHPAIASVRPSQPPARNVIPPAPAAAPSPIPPPTAAPTAAMSAAPVPAAINPASGVSPSKESPGPKVTLWSEDDYGFINEDHAATTGQTRKRNTFPAAALAGYEQKGSYGSDPEDELEQGDDENAPRTAGRWFTGIIVAMLVAVALFFAISHIGTLFSGSDVASSPGGTSAAQNPTGTPEPSASAKPVVVAPVIKALTDITVYAPGAQRYNDIFIPRLKDATDGNKATYWLTAEFSNADFANMMNSIDLAVELQSESTVSSVTINQIAGSGGQFNILTNSQPSLDGATKVGSGSFTGPDFTLKVAPAVKTKYVIINFTQLPKLQPFATYPYGLKIAEISIQ